MSNIDLFKPFEKTLLNTFFNNDFNSLFYNENVYDVNMFDDESNFYIEMKVPGFNKNDINITVKNNMLTIKTEKEYKYNDNNKNYYVKEFEINKFVKNIRLPDNLDTDKIDVKYDNGILKINIKKTEKSKPKIIKIK